MFAPQSAYSIEVGARYYRADNEAWAANERLIRLVRSSSNQQSPLDRMVTGLLSFVRRQAVATAGHPTTIPSHGPGLAFLGRARQQAPVTRIDSGDDLSGDDAQDLAA
jgi:hypothetical protein